MNIARVPFDQIEGNFQRLLFDPQEFLSVEFSLMKYTIGIVPITHSTHVRNVKEKSSLELFLGNRLSLYILISTYLK